MTESVIIIGAGVAGLAAGCYAQMNGYQSQIFELHDIPGGLCTAWERKGYVFDGCIHYLLGSAPGQPFHRIWQELGAVQGRSMIDHAEIMRVVDREGRTFHAYCDPAHLEQHIAELSPADAKLGRQLADGVRLFTRFDMSLLRQTPQSLMGSAAWAKLGGRMLPFVGALARWALVSAEDFAQRFQDPLLRRALPLVFGWGEIPMMGAISVLAAMHTGNASFPSGGSLAFVRALERRYLSLGGQIHYRAQVEKILVDSPLPAAGRGRAAGVRLYDDREFRADVVISAADGQKTIFGMLDGQFADSKTRRRYDGHLPIHSQVQVSLGVARDLSGQPHWATYLLDQPLTIAGEERRDIGVKHYCFDPSLAPPGKSVVEVMIRSDYDYWQRIYGRKLYDTEQIQVSDQVIDFLETLYPGIGSQIEVKDVATPLSYERYTGNWQGSTCGWLLTKDTMRMMISGIGQTLPGLANFYLCGQWVEPGGMVPMAAISGRNVVQLLCHAAGKSFTTSLPS
jgi:phytoene dehydrogenase-like protein